ncbi:MAG: hypothetical protein ACOCYZ_03895 [Halococcoides sp.]
MKRREFIASIGTVAVGATAGCSMFRSPELSRPRVIDASGRYGSDTTVTLEIENTGGQSGSFNGTLRAVNGSVDASQNVSAVVPPGENATFESDPIDVPGAGDYEIVVEGPPSNDSADDGTPTPVDLTRTTLTVDPGILDAGESLTVDDSLRVTVEDCSIQDSVFVGEGDGAPSDVFFAPSGAALGLFEVSVENASTDRQAWRPSERIVVPGGEIYSAGTVGGVSGAGPNIADDHTLDPSTVLDGYVLAKLPREIVTERPSIGIQTAPSTERPEYLWSFEDAAVDGLAEVRLDDVTAPETATSGEDYSITLSFENTGDAPGTGRAVLQYYDEGGLFSTGEWTALSTVDDPAVELDVPPGETASTTVSNQPPERFDGTFRYRVLPSGTEWTTEF